MRIPGTWNTPLLGIALAFALTGCLKPKAPTMTLRGQVSVQRKPLLQGQLFFLSLEKGQAPPAQAEIRDGHYLAKNVPLGKVSVEFNASEATGRMLETPGGQVAEYRSLIPERHRGGIPLEITPDKAEVDFHLED